MRETVECYGTTMEQSKIKVFYHGISMMYLDTFIVMLCCPTSTTAQLEVATTFADRNGIILELEKCALGHSLRYFNCSLLSSYGSEDERLFVGGRYPLQLRSIRIVSNRHNYKHFVKALTLFNKIIAATRLSPNEIKKVTQTDYKAIVGMIKHHIGEKTNKFPEYINACFDQLVCNKSVIRVNIEYMKLQYPLFYQIFVDKNHDIYFVKSLDNNLLAFDFIANLFQQCVEISSIETDSEENAFSGQAHMYLSSLINILNKINKNEKSKLNTIRIFGKRDLSDIDHLYSDFQILFLNKTGWQLQI
eukprot:422699_1